ncbi:T9SS type A sorting domain-containing protein [Luteibaculum oceani]|uniref:T9SS type A sorting domain-containing protein n=1 Tax=Luteibaculum oceani TaxID=1294296 RepID=A0A5C6UUA8_9FLAO|nr:T9SS type A sorting domain-containing protein [Luteibaculum oceani]TXC76953.1 T9SS type A sorting domain-containing protein [Luteibaculum oceani]
MLQTQIIPFNLTAHTVGAELATSFQWVKNGEDIVGAVLPNFRPDLSHPGNYSVKVRYDNGCIAESDDMELNYSSNPSPSLLNRGGGADGKVLHISDKNSIGVSAFPNPMKASLEIIFKNSASGISKLMLFDMTGKLVVKRDLSESNLYKHKIDVSSLESGFYTLVIEGGSEKFSKILIKD